MALTLAVQFFAGSVPGAMFLKQRLSGIGVDVDRLNRKLVCLVIGTKKPSMPATADTVY